MACGPEPVQNGFDLIAGRLLCDQLEESWKLVEQEKCRDVRLAEHRQKLVGGFTPGGLCFGLVDFDSAEGRQVDLANAVQKGGELLGRPRDLGSGLLDGLAQLRKHLGQPRLRSVVFLEVDEDRQKAVWIGVDFL